MISEHMQGETVVIIRGGGVRIAVTALGVLKALQAHCIRNGITITRVVGSSGGAIVGGLFSLGYHSHEIFEILRTLWKPEIFTDYNYTRFYKGFIKGKLVEEALAKAFSRKTFSETRTPLSILASTSKFLGTQPVLLDEGDIHSSVRASVSIPLLFAPKVLGEVEYIDGEVSVRDIYDILSLVTVKYMKPIDRVYYIELDHQASTSIIDRIGSWVQTMMRNRRVGVPHNVRDQFIHTEIIMMRIPVKEHVPLWKVNNFPELIRQGEYAALVALEAYEKNS